MMQCCPQTATEVFDGLFARHSALRSCEADIRLAFMLVTEVFRGGGKLLVCGNGGSAADSEHIVGELMKSFRFKRPVDQEFAEAYQSLNGVEVPSWLEGALPTVSLVSQTSLMTAFSNDESAVGVFAQQVYGYGNRGDALLIVSTSGSSPNVVEAARVAIARDMRVVALTGASRSPLYELANVCVRVPENETFRVQEMHLPIYHALCAAIEAELFGGETR